MGGIGPWGRALKKEGHGVPSGERPQTYLEKIQLGCNRGIDVCPCYALGWEFLNNTLGTYLWFLVVCNTIYGKINKCWVLYFILWYNNTFYYWILLPKCHIIKYLYA